MKPASGEKQKRGRPRSLKQGHRVVAVSLDPHDLEWVDSLVRELKQSGTVGEGATRSSVIRSAVSHMIQDYKNLDLQGLMAQFPSAAFENRDEGTGWVPGQIFRKP